jgi:crossover junction endodeoxyribonuclease RuvC
MQILGIDPGSRVTGFGMVEGRPGRLRHVEHGALRPPAGAPLAERLGMLHAGLCEVIERLAPEAVCVEEVFVAASPRSALILGQARGAALAAAAGAGLPVHEYGARSIKLAVAGSGAAGKAEVQRMVQRLLGLSGISSQDASDALAAAICHVQSGGLPAGVRRGRGRPRGRRAGRFVVRVER